MFIYRTLRDALLRRWRRDDGISLIEVLVVTGLLVGVLAVAQTAILTAQKTLADNSSRLDSIGQVRVSLDAMSKVIRTAIMPSQLNGTCSDCDIAAFIQGDNTYVQFYANIDNEQLLPASGSTTAGPSRVTYTYNPTTGTLTELIQRPNSHDVTDYNYQYCNPSTQGCEVRKREIAKGVVNKTAEPVFTYYDRDGGQLPVPLQVDLQRLKAVDSIDLVLKVRETNRIETSTMTTRVTLPNADSVVQPTTSPG